MYNICLSEFVQFTKSEEKAQENSADISWSKFPTECPKCISTLHDMLLPHVSGMDKPADSQALSTKLMTLKSVIHNLLNTIITNSYDTIYGENTSISRSLIASSG